ncbi:ribonuclease Z, mitochondrial [Phymastichus coffea]|uniref:ribonuclease Z, mitochondrial n=1 Tax=Phymastichus coffea TaxID=108790 RepID=UPI00273B2EFB|nr:ribonuclease Z, mitochondrial [Phymastichus coffea]
MIFITLQASLKSFYRAAILIRSYKIKHTPLRPPMMPKDNAYLQDLQMQRRKQKLKSTKYAPSMISLQVIGNGSPADSRSVLLNTDHTNYLFNCGEGTQRLATEHHCKLSKIEHIFVTKASWDNMGGIPGALLTIQDTGVPKICLHGPEGTNELMEAIDNFVNINQLNVEAVDTSRTYKDHVMTVEYHTIKNIISKKSTEESKEDDSISFISCDADKINFYSDKPNQNGKRPRTPGSPAPVTRKGIPLIMNRINTMMVYICKIHPKAGSLNLVKCVDAGIKSGPDMGKLKDGKDVTLPNGTVVRSVDVVNPAEPGPLFIVMECPNEDWIDVIVNNPIFLNYQKNTAENKEKIASYIVHFTPAAILNDPRYKEWMHKFGESTEHLIINEESKCNGSESIHKMQHQLHLINGEIFPFFENKTYFSELNNVENEIQVEENQLGNENKLKIRHCKTLNGIQLRPHKGFDNTEVKLNPREYVQEALSIDGLCDAIADLQTETNNRIKSLGTVEEYPKIVFLGTGCSIPNKIRNTSSILLQISENNNILLDCGEGTAGQLVRFFGEEQADHILKNLNAIYVSHLHADHHLGFIGLLKQRERVTDDKLYLIAPEQIEDYLNLYDHRFESICKNFKLISNRDLLLGQNILPFTIAKEMYERLEISNINTAFVKHCPYAYGVALTLKDERKISYSGDTIPCDSFVKLAKNSFLLIHEATMEDGLETDAAQKHHSTISQAVNVGVKSNAEFTILTHFSQRYSKMPLLPKQGTDLSRVGIAYDFMKVKMSELSLLPLMYPSLSILFREFTTSLDEKTAKRQFQKERLIKNAKN